MISPVLTGRTISLVQRCLKGAAFITSKPMLNTEESPDDLDKNHQVKVDAHLVM